MAARLLSGIAGNGCVKDGSLAMEALDVSPLDAGWDLITSGQVWDGICDYQDDGMNTVLVIDDVSMVEWGESDPAAPVRKLKGFASSDDWGSGSLSIVAGVTCDSDGMSDLAAAGALMRLDDEGLTCVKRNWWHRPERILDASCDPLSEEGLE